MKKLKVLIINNESQSVVSEQGLKGLNGFSYANIPKKTYLFSKEDEIAKTIYFHSFLVSGKMFIIPKKYHLMKVMGKGSYGIVWKAQNTLNGELVAIKKMMNPFKMPGNIIRILREIRLLKFLNHENIIQIKDLFPAVSVRSLESIYVVTEFMSSDLMQIIHSQNPLPEEQVIFILMQILSALKYLHSANILHRDLKPSNILINEDWEIKIWDFGLARAMSTREINNKDLTVYVTTRIYRAPELLFGWENYSRAIDMWSVGWIFAEMLNRRPLFGANNHIKQAGMIYNLVGSLEEIKNSIFASKIRFFEPLENRKDPNGSFDKIFQSHSEKAKDLLRKMLYIDPSKRITIDDALNHPYFEDYSEEIEDLENWSRTFDTEFEEGNTDDQLKAEVLSEIFSFAPKIDEEIYNKQNHEYKLLKRSSKVHHILKQ